ncbi:hypothetical protein CONLIGDRAFT_470098 [Coniochaeta ligniaria NRRL 30616]|uniref:Uncharacterized protein n=1 Tax=Coniochaeta ligniaria NRRL 30616 TaxID=1408157 RepID=A0A1J7IG28_9PEZI|nr:hypothetical protein CONLIGDRAFT_470098 [Coniochaeta ligniaria NRRL 30616]
MGLEYCAKSPNNSSDSNKRQQHRQHPQKHQQPQFTMMKLTLAFVALLAACRPASAAWDLLDFNTGPNCPANPGGLVFIGSGPRACENFAAGQRPISFQFTSTGEELQLFFAADCNNANSRQVFSGNGQCFSVLAGGQTATSFNVINPSRKREGIEAPVNATEGGLVTYYGPA